ncbi:MAG: phenylalanine--tRNA ligase subunit beta [Clostridia bacterium]|nr:phenylalanine--tRNA ligase subunit beta [Clostridia bacterium]
MYISMNWISDFVDLDGIDKKQLIHRFTLSTAEVEEVFEKGADTYGVIVARIASVENHPNSKKLHLLKVDTGKDLVDCVCGAPNVREGMRVAFATEGGSVSGHPISAATVAGFVSHGMCCSEAELGISADNSGLWEITDDIPLGTDIKDAYQIDDIIFEVDNKSLTNRPDLWGHYGIAREFATLAERQLRPIEAADLSVYDNLPEIDIKIEETRLCYRYIGIKAENIKHNVSPVNMRIRLYYCGSRSINLLADLTNYVMLELGQPMHAFDMRKVQSIEVKRFDTPFTFTTLDGNERHIDENTLMICTNNTPSAIAGIMGGLDSEIEDDTDSLLLESANFDGVSIRKTSSRIGLRTDASMRYEKILDPELTETATKRFIKLLLDIAPEARVASKMTDRYPRHYEKITIDIDKPYINKYTGIEISDEEIVKTLIALGFGVSQNGEVFTVDVPSWRATKDVTIKADLIEEITRIYGYDNFKIETTLSPLFPVRKEAIKTDVNRAKDILVQRYNLNEVHSYIWCDAAKYKELKIDVPENPRLINAQTPDHATLRASIVPTILTFVSENRGFSDDYGIFEVGEVVEGYGADGLCVERKKLSFVLSSRTASEEVLFLRARDIITHIVTDIKHKDACYLDAETKFNWQHPRNTYSVAVGDDVIGVFGTVHPQTAGKIDKKAALVYAEIDMDTLSGVAAADISYSEPSKFPAIDIDLSFTADIEKVDFAKVCSLAKDAGGDLLGSVKAVDVYESEDGNSSLTVRFTFVSAERTLSKAEVSENVDAVISALSDIGLTMKTA